MGFIATFPGWGPIRILPLHEHAPAVYWTVEDAKKQFISARFEIDLDKALITVDLPRQHDAIEAKNRERSILNYIFKAMKANGADRAALVAVRNRSFVPSIAFVGVNPSTNEWEYLRSIPRLIDDNTGRNPYEVDNRFIDPKCRKAQGYHPYHAPGGASPRCSIPCLNNTPDRTPAYSVRDRI